MEPVEPADWPCGSLTAIVDVELDGGPTYDDVVRLWFEVMAEPVCRGLLRRWYDGDARVSGNLYVVWPGGGDDHREPFGPGSLDRALDEVARRGRPELVLLSLEEESDNGLRVPGATGECFSAVLQVRWLEEVPGGVHLSASGMYWSPDLTAPPEVQSAWCDGVERIVSEAAADFANITDDNASWRTALDSALDRSEAESVAARRSILRGYSWVTVCGSELVGRLGGVTALTDSQAFWRVQSLPGGSVWLQATERLNDYDSTAIERAFTVLSPVLPSGRVEPVWGNSWPRLVHADASETSDRLSDR